MPWTIYSQRPATSAAARALIEDPHRSDAALAELAGVSTSTIGSVRARLTQIGVIPAIPVEDRLARPRPQRASATASAIAQLGPSASPRQVADAAGCSLQAAWQALRRLSPRLADAAGAIDAISVVRSNHDYADAAGATDTLSVRAVITCACGTTFEVSTADAAGRGRRFCSSSCRNADSRARGHKPRPRTADPGHQPPVIQPLPSPPDLSRAGARRRRPPSGNGGAATSRPSAPQRSRSAWRARSGRHAPSIH